MMRGSRRVGERFFFFQLSLVGIGFLILVGMVARMFSFFGLCGIIL